MEFNIVDGVLTEVKGKESYVKIPDGVRKIGENAFKYHNEIKTIEFPDSLEKIGYGAFYNCTSLTEINFSSSLNRIGDYAFKDCTGLVKIDLPESLKEIEKGAFEGCTRLTEIALPESLQKIKRGAFFRCTSLIKIQLPSGLKTIEHVLFGNCQELNTIYLPDGIESIGNGAFFGCQKLRKVNFPKGLKKIGSRAFYHCTGLTTITFPDSLEDVGVFAFEGCTGITTINFPTRFNQKEKNDFQLNEFYQETIFFNPLLARFLKEKGYCLTEKQVETLNEMDLTNTNVQKNKKLSIIASCFSNAFPGTLSLLSLDFAKYGRKYIVPLEDFEIIFLFSDLDDQILETIVEKCELPKFSKSKLLEKYVLNDEIKRISILVKHGIIDSKDIDQALELANQNKKTSMIAFLLNEKNKLKTKKI